MQFMRRWTSIASMLLLAAVLLNRDLAAESKQQTAIKGHFFIAAGKFEEICVDLKSTESIHYQFKSTQMVSFSIHYHKGDQVITPLQEKTALSGAGGFQAKLKQSYCLLWLNRTAELATMTYGISRAK